MSTQFLSQRHVRLGSSTKARAGPNKATRGNMADSPLALSASFDASHEMRPIWKTAKVTSAR